MLKDVIASDLKLDRKKWEKKFRTAARPHIEKAIRVNGRRMNPKSFTGATVKEIDFNQRVKRWIANKLFNFSFFVVKTTDQKLSRMLNAGIDAGETIDEIAMRVSERFEDLAPSRCEMIARTEVISASNYGAYEAIVQADVGGQKEWIATRDNRTRESHWNLDGEAVGVNDKFSNGLEYPGDPAGEPGEIINCRCTIGWLDEGEEPSQQPGMEDVPYPD